MDVKQQEEVKFLVFLFFTVGAISLNKVIGDILSH